MVFRRLQYVDRNAVGETGVVIYGVEKFKEHLQPFEDDVEFQLIDLALAAGFVGERWDEE